MQPTPDMLYLQIEDNNGEDVTIPINGLHYAWGNNIALTNDNISNQDAYTNMVIQVGAEGNQQLNIFQDLAFTNCTIYTNTWGANDPEDAEWTVYYDNTLSLNNTMVKVVALIKCGKVFIQMV